MGPCKNKHCRSYGQVHPNCKCYARGGMVDGFCDKDNMHDSDCQYYAQGGAVDSKNMKGFNLSKFKKQKEDSKTVTMIHENGHTIKIMKSGLSPLQKKQMERLPVHLEAGGSPVSMEVPEDAAAAAPPSVDDVIKQADERSKALLMPSSEDNQPLDTSKQGPALASNEMVPGAMPQNAPQRFENQPNFTPPKNSNPNDPNNINLNSVYSNEMKGIQTQAAAESQLAKDQQINEKNRQNELAEAQRHSALSFMNINKNINDTLQDIKSSHINPNHYLENQTTPQKISTAIGLFLGGFSKNGVNPAQQFLNQQIDRDIMAQKNDIENKKTVYSGYLDQYKNATVADQMARATQLGIYSSKVAEAAAKAGSPLAQAKLLQLSSELQQKMIPLQQNAHLINQFDQFNGGGGNQPGAGRGNEAQFVHTLESARTINPTIYADQQAKYIPKVGVADQAVPGEIKSRLINLASITPLVDKAIALQEKYGKLGAVLNTKVGENPFENIAEAEAIQRQLTPLLGQATDVSGAKSVIYNNYAHQVGELGSMNLGGTLKTLKALKSQVESDTNSAINSAGIHTFSDYKSPSGLNNQDQQKLNIFINKNPQYKNDQGSAVEKLKAKGIINGG